MPHRPPPPSVPCPLPGDVSSSEEEPYDFGDENDFDDVDDVDRESNGDRSLPPTPGHQGSRPLPLTPDDAPDLPLRPKNLLPDRNYKKPEEPMPKLPPRKPRAAEPKPRAAEPKRDMPAPQQYNRGSDESLLRNKAAPVKVSTPPQISSRHNAAFPPPERTPPSKTSLPPTPTSPPKTDLPNKPACIPPRIINTPLPPTPSEDNMYSMMEDEEERPPNDMLEMSSGSDDSETYLDPSSSSSSAVSTPVQVNPMSQGIKEKLTALQGNLPMMNVKAPPKKLADPTSLTVESPVTAPRRVLPYQNKEIAMSEIQGARSRLNPVRNSNQESPEPPQKPCVPVKPTLKHPKPETSPVVSKPAASSLKECSWYHGKVKREEAESRVSGKEGQFLVRDSTSGKETQPYTLVVFCEKLIFNLQLRKTEQNLWTYGKGENDTKTFDSVVQLVEYYQDNEIYLSKKGHSDVSTRLSSWPRR